jgi:hypothetical protein
MSGSRIWLKSALSSLVASSCCIVQLSLSLLGYSCFGIVKLLRPFQPILVCSVILWWMTKLASCCHSERRNLIGPVLLSVMILLSPALVDWKLNAAPVHLTDAPVSSSLIVKIQGMGCSACALAAKQSLELIPEMDGCKISMDDESALCALKNGQHDVEDASLESALERIGQRFIKKTMVRDHRQ